MGLTHEFYQTNRRTLARGDEHGLYVFAANTLMQRNNDMAYMFEQEANFRYLTGINDPDWLVIIDGSEDKCWLVAPYVDEVHQTFDGLLPAADALAISGADAVIGHDEAETLLRQLAKKHSLVRTLGAHPHREFFNFFENPAQKKLRATLDRIFNSVDDCRQALAKLRANKQPDEIAMIRKAIRLTENAFEAVHANLSSFGYEYEIEAEFDYVFKRQGHGHAYDPIVASGLNACTLHYVSNRSKLRKRSLVLLDIGASAHGYASDITRTYAFGEPTRRQRQVHEAVRQAHLAIIDLLAPHFTLERYQKSVDDIMTEALKRLGLYKSEASLRRYFPHAISHGLGIDVHDSLGAPKYFMQNMVLTVEPGIYIPEESIGVRIEDDILITKDGNENLSGSLSTGL